MNTVFTRLLLRGIALFSALGLAAGCLHSTPIAPAVDPAYSGHVQTLHQRLPNRDFSIVVEPPFVLVGDVPTRQMIRYAQRTVRPLVRHLRSAFFSEEPGHIIDVWVFRNSSSFQRHVPQLFGHAPASHFGYMSAEHHALIVNMGTGAGASTLRHEVVHPFVAANLPNCPAWFDEGLASLYERVDDRADTIRGVPNWRLALLQEGIRQQDTLPFGDLMRLKGEQFYTDKLGLHYAQSRYLCFFLQEEGLLGPFCKAFVQDQDKDPTGYWTLCKILEVPDLDTFQLDWEAYIMTLSFY